MDGQNRGGRRLRGWGGMVETGGGCNGKIVIIVVAIVVTIVVIVAFLETS